MKHIIAGVLVAVALVPAISSAQTLEEQYRNYLIQLIEILQARIAELIELQDNMKKTVEETKELPAVGGSERVIEAPVTATITAELGDVLAERDDLGRVYFSWSVKTYGEKMQVKLQRPNGGYVIDGGLNKETDQTFEIGPEFPGVFKWTVTAVKGGVAKTESGQFEIQ